MKIFFAALLVIITSGITMAVDSPNTPPVAERKMKMPRPADGDRIAKERPDVRERLAERHDEYIKWLEKSYPDEAKALAQTKEANPELYLKRLKESFDKYGRLAHAEKNNPEMAKLLREDIEIKSQEQKLLAQIRAAADESQKKKLTEELQTLVGKRFDVIVAQKQLRYQELNKRLEEMKKEVQKQQTDLDKLKGQKNEEVKKRVDGLINKTEEINW
jgi:hypothetical protein